MNQEAVTFMNWLDLLLLLPATVILAWKLVTEKLRKKRISPDIIGVSLVVAAMIGWAELNISNNTSRFAWALRIVHHRACTLYKTLWPILKQRLRG
jgi:hypothetical protein